MSWPVPDARGTVLLIHGFAEHVRRYDHVVAALTAMGLAVVAVDLPGHGRSGGRRGDIRAFGDYEAALDALFESLGREERERPLIVVAHSMGALVALRWLQTRGHRPAAVVLSAPWFATDAVLSRVTLLLKGVLSVLAPGFPVRRSIQAEGLTRDPEMQARRVADRLVVNRISARLVREVESAQRMALEEGPGVPTLVLSPGDDPITDQAAVREWCARFPEEVEMVTLPETRHEPFNDLDREETILRVCSWLERKIP
jgi:alpha-beta hydrolase superfamily lysophospholipase